MVMVDRAQRAAPVHGRPLRLSSGQALRLSSGQALPRVRGDALPEHTRYRDDGCEVHPHCLTCPLPRCRYDEPGGLRALLNASRDRQIIELRQRGAPVERIADRFRLSRRTIFRILSTSSRQALEQRSGRNGNGQGWHRYG